MVDKERGIGLPTADALQLQRAVDELPEAFREAVWLRDVEEFSYAEIARMLSITEGNVKVRVFRGRAKLAELLKEVV